MVSWSKIIDGVDVPVVLFPFMVLLVAKTDKTSLLCTGSYLGDGKVLTAAHCFPEYITASDYRVHFLEEFANGIYNVSTTENMLAFHVHPEFNRRKLSHDIAVADISVQDINISKLTIFREPRCYAPYEALNTSLDVLGYGTDNPPHLRGMLGPTHFRLRKATVAVVDPVYYPHLALDDSMIIARGDVLDKEGFVSDACAGDSGGPLLHAKDNVLVGTVSWGVGCGLSRFPGIYSRISSSLTWLSSFVSLSEC